MDKFINGELFTAELFLSSFKCLGQELLPFTQNKMGSFSGQLKLP